MGRAIAVGVIVAGGLLAAATAKAEILRFKAHLLGVAETRRGPVRPTGLADLTLDTDTRVLSWRVIYAGLSGPVTEGRFQTPPAPVSTLTAPGHLAPPYASPIVSSALLDDIEIGDLRAGLWSIVLSTLRHPDGELRGDIERAP
jgi:hypothetical protein